MKQTILTGNDVLDFNCFYNGKEEPPIFRKQFIDLKDKFVFNENTPFDLFQKVYAITSSDLSVDSANSYEIFKRLVAW